jgi:hypothetical protein
VTEFSKPIMSRPGGGSGGGGEGGGVDVTRTRRWEPPYHGTIDSPSLAMFGNRGQPSTSRHPGRIDPLPSTFGLIHKDATDVMFTDPCICGCAGGGCIPQRKYERQRSDPLDPQELEELIRFSVNGRCGYPLEDALKKQYTGLDGKDDEMFVDCKSSIALRLEVRTATSARSYNSPETYSQWLPYRKWTKQVGADCHVSHHGH